MHFTDKELAAVMKLGIDMLMADGKIHENEENTIGIELAKFVKDENKFDLVSGLSMSMDSAVAISIVATMDEEEKRHVAAFLAFIMISDGDTDPRELALLKMVSLLASFPEMTVKECIDNWKKWAKK